jgi:hypothetical protein
MLPRGRRRGRGGSGSEPGLVRPLRRTRPGLRRAWLSWARRTLGRGLRRVLRWGRLRGRLCGAHRRGARIGTAGSRRLRRVRLIRTRRVLPTPRSVVWLCWWPRRRVGAPELWRKWRRTPLVATRLVVTRLVSAWGALLWLRVLRRQRTSRRPRSLSLVGSVESLRGALLSFGRWRCLRPQRRRARHRSLGGRARWRLSRRARGRARTMRWRGGPILGGPPRVYRRRRRRTLAGRRMRRLLLVPLGMCGWWRPSARSRGPGRVLWRTRAALYRWAAVTLRWCRWSGLTAGVWVLGCRRPSLR